MTYQLHHGDCISIMPLIERESVDAVICDPPYGLGFMGKDWDHGVPGMHFWLEALRCAKPGAYLLAFGGTRTFHRLAVAIEDAGWEIRDTVMWVYGSGFPKSHDVSKAIDREAGAERTKKVWADRFHDGKDRGVTLRREFSGDFQSGVNGNEITLPATPAAVEWDGWGTALKPAWEPIIVARKPLQGTVAENVQRYGTGAMNIDACRIETDARPLREVAPLRDDFDYSGNSLAGRADGSLQSSRAIGTTSQGRWPANLIHDGSAEVLAGFPMTGSGGASTAPNGRLRNVFTDGGFSATSEAGRITEPGSAARFFYCAKASKTDRDEGLEGFEEKRVSYMNTANGNSDKGEEWQPIDDRTGEARNGHPTVKPTALMRYLCRLVTPPSGTILDPFMGSGSTGKAAMLEGFNFIGIDTEIEYVEIAARRIEHACEKMGIVVEQPMMFETQRETIDKPKQLILL